MKKTKRPLDPRYRRFHFLPKAANAEFGKAFVVSEEISITDLPSLTSFTTMLGKLVMPMLRDFLGGKPCWQALQRPWLYR